MLYTITNQGLSNGRPVSIGANTISILNRATHIFTLANFTTQTSPAYSDPEGDALSYVKILTLPPAGTLKLSGVAVQLNDLIISANISAGNFTYEANDVSPAYSSFFKFDIADVGSQSLSGLNTGIMTMSVASAVNAAPTCVGNNIISKAYGQNHVFSMADFTTNTTPAYSDPESDDPYALKVLTLPANGTLNFNGSAVVVNQEILATEVNSGLLIYVPNAAVTNAQSLSFTFAVSDVGSKIFVSSCP